MRYSYFEHHYNHEKYVLDYHVDHMFLESLIMNSRVCSQDRQLKILNLIFLSLRPEVALGWDFNSKDFRFLSRGFGIFTPGIGDF